MSRIRWIFGILTCLTAGVPMATAGDVATTQPWIVFEDFNSNSRCGIVNAGNAELVVLRDSFQLVIVSGRDTILVDTFVDADNTVFFEGVPFGSLNFEEDRDGYRTLWWTTLTDTVVDIDDFSAKPRATDAFPDQFEKVPCDACEYWDNPADCDDFVIDTPGLIFNFCGAGTREGAASAMLLLLPFKLFGRRKKPASGDRICAND